MKQYAVLHMTKYKGLVGIGAHLDRSYIQHNVDADRVRLNQELSGLRNLALEQAVEARIAEGYTQSKAIRKNAVKAVGVIMTGSHERMKEIEQDERLFQQWQKENYRFACREFGEKNIVRFVVHRDEKTPHIHCVFVPITAEGGLSAKEYMKGKECMRGYQDRYGEEMEKFGLERGLPKEITQAVHIPTSVYYRDVNLRVRESKEQTAEISVKNVLRLREVRKQVEESLTQEKVLSSDYRKRIEHTEKSYENLYKRGIDEDLRRVKQEVNLVQHAGSMGYKLNKAKSCRSYAVMEKEGDKVIINTRPNRHGHWVYMSAVDESDRGTIVDFMIRRGYEYRDIRKLSSVHLDEEVLQELSKRREVVEDVGLQYKLSKASLLRVYDEYEDRYMKERKIDERSYKGYLGECMTLGRDKAVFGLYREVDSQGKGRLCSTISYSYDKHKGSRKYFQEGLPRGLSVLKEADSKIKKIVVCESPIDALSYKQLKHGHEKEIMYVSTCGSLTKGLKEEFEGLLSGAKKHGQDIVLAFDRDDAGVRMSKQLEGICQGLRLLCSAHFPTHGKDWNEDLEEEHKRKKKKRLLSLGMSM